MKNYPPPMVAEIHADCGFSARGEIVARICNSVNELAEYMYGLDNGPRVEVPAQATGSDERVPLMFLRPCVDALSKIIEDYDLSVDPPVQMGGNMDYHRFVPWAKDIAMCFNEIVTRL